MSLLRRFYPFPRQNGSARHLGYTRVSTRSQDAKLQVEALVKSGVQERDIFADVTSGSRSAISRPGMKKLLERLFPQITRVLKINQLDTITDDVIEAAASILVIGN